MALSILEFMRMKAYKPQGIIEAADCVIGHSFGSSTDEYSVNRKLAERMIALSGNRPMIADRTLVDALPGGDEAMAHVVEGQRSSLRTEGVGTWGTLIEAKAYMDEHGLDSPLMIAQAFHIQSVVRQAGRLGITSIVPPDLPTDFDKGSEQIWTRSELLWVSFSGLRTLLLTKRGQL